ncbi:MAG: AlpA family transcriptional regulator [SAR324 cluster bacterium]|jgi:prophage regulatory protein|nr:AlpA family transcriptional regulator [SAR324 cluster bacterium]MDP7317182.1 AlpA family transcriptional regulator [SAR324 cluster bacterium]
MDNQSRKRLIRLPEVESLTGYRRSRIYDFVKQGTFPQPLKIGPRATAWVEDEVQGWIDARIEQRDNAA